MIIIKFKGGLGNQLFQYAFYKYLNKNCKHKIYVDLSHYSINNKDIYPPSILDLNTTKINILKNRFHKILNLFSMLCYKIDNKILKIPVYINDEKFSKNIINKNLSFLFFDGYWQEHHRYLSYVRELQKEIKPKKQFGGSNKKYLDLITKNNSISVHIRKGRYIYNPIIKKRYPDVTINYYKDSINYIVRRIKNPMFFVFSNDNKWVIENFTLLKKSNFILIDNEGPDYEHLYLIRNCKHNIITNSTFSWWGAWLNDNPTKIVIAPQLWEKNHAEIPKNWIKLNNS